MEAKLQEAIIKLPVILKAHIYEPKVEDVAEIAFSLGIREVVKWVEVNGYLYQFVAGWNDICFSEAKWQVFLKEKGIKEAK